MPEPIDPAPTVSFEDVTLRCVCGEVIIAAWDAANETDDKCLECGEVYVIYAEPSVHITVKTAAGDDYCYVTYGSEEHRCPTCCTPGRFRPNASSRK